MIGGIDVTGHITASGNISASGDGLFTNIGIGTNSPDEAIVIAKAAARIEFDGTDGGGGEGILYNDSGGNERYALQFPGSNKVVLSNRASNGIVEIRANTSGNISASGDGLFTNIGIGTNSPDEAIVIAKAAARIEFDGTDGGGGEGILYNDSGGNERYALQFPGSNKVVLSNRASNGIVEIRANTSTAGAAGERTITTFEDDKVKISGSLNVFSETSGHITASGNISASSGTFTDLTINNSGTAITFNRSGHEQVTIGQGNTDRFFIRNATDGRNDLVILDNGNFGIGGNDAPPKTLTVQGDISASGNLFITGDTNLGTIQLTNITIIQYN